MVSGSVVARRRERGRGGHSSSGSVLPTYTFSYHTIRDFCFCRSTRKYTDSSSCSEYAQSWPYHGDADRDRSTSASYTLRDGTSPNTPALGAPLTSALQSSQMGVWARKGGE